MRAGLIVFLIGFLFSGVPNRTRQVADLKVVEAMSVQATSASEPPASGVLVMDAGPRTYTPGWPRGLWHMTPTGEQRKLVGRRWRVHAWSPISGAVVSPRRFSERHPFNYAVLLDDQTTPLKPRADKLSCASWSIDGELLAYLTGKQRQYANSAWAIAGKLWVTHHDSPERPVQVARGVFPECPAWSPTEQSLAYLIQGDTKRSWEMRLLEGYRTEVLKEFHILAPSVFGPSMNRTFDFSNDGDLFFLARRTIYVDSAEGVTRFGPAGVLDEIRDDAGSWLRYVRSLRVSPNGLLVAATANWNKTGIVDADELLRVVPNRFRGWSGNFGILTFGLGETGEPTLELFPVDPQDEGRELPPSGRKQAVHADLGGQWFAHNDGRRGTRLFWYTPEGSRLAVMELGFRGGAVASTAGGGVDLAVWP